MFNLSEKIKNASFSKKIISFIDKALIINIPSLFFLIIISCSINYIHTLNDGYGIWRTQINFIWLLVLGGNALFLFLLTKYNFIQYSKKGLSIYLIFWLSILIYSSITLSLKYLILSISYMFFFTSILIPVFYCKVRDSFENKKNYDFINKIIALLLLLMAVSLHLLYDLKDPLLPVVILCSSPFYIASFFTNKIESILLQYRATFFIYLFFISTTIYPYLFILSLILFFISKFYFFVKYDIKYPTFLDRYDISR